MFVIPLYSDCCLYFFYFNDTAPTEIYTLSLHDALPIYRGMERQPAEESWRRHVAASPHPDSWRRPGRKAGDRRQHVQLDRKSTRLNSSHSQISYAVFCLKKKTKYSNPIYITTDI